MSDPRCHSWCDRCWQWKYGDEEPVRLKEEHRSEERCCVCGVKNRSGIFVRGDVGGYLCGGRHD